MPLFDHIPLPIYIFQDNSFKYVNRQLVDLTGFPGPELLQMNVWDLVHPEDRPLLMERATQRMTGNNIPPSYEFRALNRYGEVLHLRGYFSLITFAQRPAILGQLLDITRERNLLEELRRAEARLRDIFENVNDIIYLHDLEGRFLALNPALTRYTGFLPDELAGREISSFLHPQVKHLLGQYLKEITEKGEARGLMRGLTKEGREIFWEYHSVLFKGKNPFVRGIARDVTEQVHMGRKLKDYMRLLEEKNRELVRINEQLLAAKEKLEKMARTDFLTGLGNRLAFQEALEKESSRSMRCHQPCSLLMIDVTNFKIINDNLGHPAGDRALKRIAKLIQQSCRRYDLCFRIGGDEFAVILPCTGEEGAREVADRLRKRIAGEAITPGFPLPVCLSIGVATLGQGREISDHEELIRLADTRMYQEKCRQKAAAS
ncbi:PAS domain S-box-containing protein/diguanylate cyclase (GGDEF) domain-containing protein [Desulfofundulus australicus DSM 11792]|uniref:PAS domain S-box-containing protein/diguanylate cyclase (GGDEF) domain-containing protein n=1 Tax=Desulfofundulus australicus DSM 11792 TaxID=1121425 RepID=A0A1M5AKL7_9FIRM|nr:sensor domain-containing diguanylate cyclase [Desulfofundulus australicus]SHF30811.1 PAS domain S-box-containing protein/diguanylate cyclase (GGDEF) domain-containing protein [Desulfofundulus australicus DSM 11792]